MPLTAGAIAFVAWNADGDDGLAFVATEDLPAGSVIRFSDNEWNGLPVGQGGGFNTGEGSMTWNGPDEIIRAGTVVELLNISAPSRSASLGTLSGGSLALAASDETVYAYVGESEQVPSAFLSAITNSTASAGFSAATGPLSGTGLAAATTALALPGSADVAAYAGPTGFASRAEALAVLANSADYRLQDGAGDQSADAVPPDAPFLTSPLSALSGAAFNFSGDASAASLVSLQANAATKAEGLAFTLTVNLSGAAPAGGREVLLALSGAVADVDKPQQSVTVPEGQTSASFDLRSLANTLPEADRSLTVTATLEGTQREVTVTILDDDRPTGGVLSGVAILPPAESLAGSVTTPVASNILNVVRVGSYSSGSGAGGAESIAFDTSTARAYVTNAAADRIDALDLATPSQPAPIYSIDLRASLPGFGYGEVNSVAVRAGLVAVAIQNADGGEPGVVALFDGASGTLLKAITVGIQPDQLVFNRDGSLLLVANEAERFLDRSGAAPVVENAPGTVSVISVPQDPTAAAVRNTVGFDALDSYRTELGGLGIRTLGATTVGGIAIPDASVSEDLEPEYIAISPDGTRAFVTLQEANAVAVIDLTNASADRPLSLLPLGAVDFSLPGNEADFSDRDGPGNTPSISIGNGSIKGLLQPDAIAAFSVGGVTYFATANEGDSRILGDTALGDPALNEIRASALQPGAPAAYARLNLDTVWSTPGDLYAFGGRGFSVFRANSDGTIAKVSETGGDFDQIVAALPNANTVFNGENGGAFDTRSDNKGAEPEGIVVGTVGGVPYAFVGLERLGGVMAWDLSDPAAAKFVRYIPPASADYGPEVLTFVPAESSPNGRALLLSANEVSGSVTVYEVGDLTRISGIQGSGATSALGSVDSWGFRT